MWNFTTVASSGCPIVREAQPSKLADALGVGRSNVYRWVNEVRDPNPETVISIVQVLEVLRPEAAAKFRQLYMRADD